MERWISDECVHSMNASKARRCFQRLCVQPRLPFDAVGQQWMMRSEVRWKKGHVSKTSFGNAVNPPSKPRYLMASIWNYQPLWFSYLKAYIICIGFWEELVCHHVMELDSCELMYDSSQALQLIVPSVLGVGTNQLDQEGEHHNLSLSLRQLLITPVKNGRTMVILTGRSYILFSSALHREHHVK